MNIKFLDTFRLKGEKEDFKVVRASIENDVEFHGPNLWILFFAILVASLGLNMNSTAVVIGAMLISPLMGPIVGIGFGVAINNLRFIQRAFRNYLFAAAVGLVASTIYFLLTPIDEAHSEILARTMPTIYDVLIALFGGFAGIIAIGSKYKGNVIPGVAIATALMPPLCTAGYGLATLQFTYFFGAIYLYLINSVFIAAATLATSYLMKFPKKEYDDPAVEKRARIIIWSVVLITLIPSIYLGYNIVSQNKFTERANRFISEEAKFPNNYLLNKEIDADKRKLSLTFGGAEISAESIMDLKLKLQYYDLENVTLQVNQGFSFLKDNQNEQQVSQLALALKRNEDERLLMKANLDSLNEQEWISKQIYSELKVQYPDVLEAIIQPVFVNKDSASVHQSVFLVLVRMKTELKQPEKDKLESWLKVRLNRESLKLVFEK